LTIRQTARSTDPFRRLYAAFGSVSLSRASARGVRDAIHEALLGPARLMPANSPRVPVRRRERLTRMLVLSLALHLEILALFLLILPELPVAPEPEQEPQGKGSPTSIAMVTDAGTAAGAVDHDQKHAPGPVVTYHAAAEPNRQQPRREH
jgi:hypothetical protein